MLLDCDIFQQQKALSALIKASLAPLLHLLLFIKKNIMVYSVKLYITCLCVTHVSLVLRVVNSIESWLVEFYEQKRGNIKELNTPTFILHKSFDMISLLLYKELLFSE